jgi:K+-transporting ATPase ATPase C chain
VTGISQIFFPKQANGNLIEVNGVIVGSELLGQNFTGTQYFWGRPSATSNNPYNAFDQETLTGSSGSNLGPLSQALFDSMQGRIDYLHKADPNNKIEIPIDLVTNSGSGLDPHVYVESAYLQIPRVARNRGMSEQTLTNLVDQFIEKPLFEDAYVNILMLNLALDGIKLNK